MIDRHLLITPTASRQLGPCLICDADAIGINFGAATCAPCKAFFRRNAVKLGTVNFVCQQEGDFSVLHQSRRMCNCCRLAKCFRVGMQKSLIRSDVEKEARKELVGQNRLKRMQLLVTHNLTLIRPPNLLRLTSTQSKYLDSFDQTLLTNVISAHEKAYTAAERIKYQNFPKIAHSSTYSFFNEYGERHATVIEYFKIIPEFARLSMGDKIRLVRDHFSTMYSINEPIILGSITNNLLNSVKNSLPTDVAMKVLRSLDIMFLYTTDLTLLKLVLIVQCLSCSITRYYDDTNMDRVYDDSRTIFAGQNVYAELLWRYIVSRSPSERDAVKFFNKLLRDLLFVQRTYYEMECYVYSLESEIDQMAPLMQSMWLKSNKMEISDNNDNDDDIAHC